ncbi:MAG: HEAT repeat domain-containing protein [Planctomycetes bacterium]|nr:HEAT repeat domain-containing protein [Planctomycetota bacterium]
MATKWWKVRFGLTGLMGFVAGCALLFWLAVQMQPVHRWTRALNNDDPDVRLTAMRGLRAMGSEAVPALMKALKSKKVSSRVISAILLGELGSASEPAVPALVQALADRDPEVRWVAAEALVKIGVEVPQGLESLIQLLGDTDVDVRWRTATAIGRLGPKARDAVPALIELAKTDDQAKYQARYALSKLVDAADIPALIDLLRDDRDWVQWTGAEVISSIGEKAVPPLAGLLSRENTHSRFGGVLTLGMIGPAASSTLPALNAAMKDSDGSVRVKAAWAVWKVGQEAEPTVPVLIAAVEDESEETRMEAITLLGEIGPAAHAAAPSLVETLKDQEKSLRYQAAITLSKMGLAAHEAVPVLVEAMEDKSGPRLAAVLWLGSIGPEAKDAFPALLRLAMQAGNDSPLTTAEENLRNQAVNAARKIDPDSATKAFDDVR